MTGKWQQDTQTAKEQVWIKYNESQFSGVVTFIHFDIKYKIILFATKMNIFKSEELCELGTHSWM